MSQVHHVSERTRGALSFVPIVTYHSIVSNTGRTMLKAVPSFLFLVALIGLSGISACTVVTDFDECTGDADCPTGRCVDGICEGPTGCTVHDDCGTSDGQREYCITGACRVVDATLCTVDDRLEESDEELVHMGMLMPLTGRNGPKGEATVDGARVAIDQINQSSGGIGDRKASLITCDTLSDPSQAVEAADHLVNDLGIRVVLGALLSDATIDVAEQVTIDAGALLISPASTSSIITDLDDDDLVWRTVPSDTSQGRALTKLLIQEDFQDVAVLYSDNDYGNGLFSIFQAAFGEFDASSRLEDSRFKTIAYSVDQGDLQTETLINEADQLFNANGYVPDVIVVIGSIESQQIIRAIDDNYFGDLPVEDRPTWMLTDGGRDPGLFADDFSDLAGRIIGTSPQEVENEVTQSFEIRFEAQSSIEVSNAPFADNAYDSAFLAALTIGTVSEPLSPEPGELRGAMALMSAGDPFAPGDSFRSAVDAIRTGSGIDYTGASGDVTLDPTTGDVLAPIEGWAIPDTGGEFVSLGVLVEAPE